MKQSRRILALLLAVVMLSSAVCAHPFGDVPVGEWYEPYVQYVYENKLMNGTSADSFGAGVSMNRAMVVTVLYRMAGSPEVSADAPFADVQKGSFYEKPVAWAYENGIVMGVTATEFAPGADVLRCQLVTFFYRYAQAMGFDTSARADLSGYRDRAQVAPFAADAFSWAVAEGIVSGMSADLLAPNGTANRAQCAVILFRIDRLFKGETGSWLALDDMEMVLGTSERAKCYYVGNGTLTWQTSDPAVVTVSGGIVTTVGEGTATITASDGTKTATATVTVADEVLKLSESYIEMKVGETVELKITYTGNNKLTWKSSDLLVATATNGVVKALGEGTTYITVSDGKKNATCKIKVEAVHPVLEIIKPDEAIIVGNKYQFNVKVNGDSSALTWGSNNESIATVDQNGVVTALKVGRGSIFVTDGTNRAFCYFDVEQVKTEEIRIVGTDGPFYNGVTRYKGDYVILRIANIPNEATQEVLANSSNANIVTASVANANGGFAQVTLNFLKAGTATITLTSGDGAISQSYTITVKDDYDFNPGNRQLTPEEFADYTTKVMCANGFTYDETCTSWRQFIRTKEQLNFNTAKKDALELVHIWWPNGKRYCQIIYVGQNEDGHYVFHECWG